MKKKIAIIGAATGQLSLCMKAKEMGLETYCFAWPKGAVCKDYVDHFIPISIFEMDTIVEYCKEYGIDGVVSNASETTALVASYVAEKLGKVGTPYKALKNIQDKAYVREKTNGIQGLTPVDYKLGKLEEILSSFPRPYVLKPVTGAAKKGVNYVDDSVKELSVPDDLKDAVFMAETYVEGKEYSVESMSYHGQHQVIQITEKISTGAPHFVELEHHQPAALPVVVADKIRYLIPNVLQSVGFTDGASHTEIKVDDAGHIYLIEVNPRGGGGMISSDLVGMSTDYDYLKELLLVALDEYVPVNVHDTAYAGIYFLSAYTARLLPYFERAQEKWIVRRERTSNVLTNSIGNYDRDGYIIYCSNKKIIL